MREWNETDISVNEKKEYTKKNKKIGQWKYNKDREHKNNQMKPAGQHLCTFLHTKTYMLFLGYVSSLKELTGKTVSS